MSSQEQGDALCTCSARRSHEHVWRVSKRPFRRHDLVDVLVWTVEARSSTGSVRVDGQVRSSEEDKHGRSKHPAEIVLRDESKLGINLFGLSRNKTKSWQYLCQNRTSQYGVR